LGQASQLLALTTFLFTIKTIQNDEEETIRRVSVRHHLNPS
jgi:hypothetical protein